MRFLALFCLSVLTAIVSDAQAGKTQVSANSFSMLTKGAVYGRSDGLAQDTTSRGLWTISNGQPAGVVGVGFYEDFTKYGAGKGFSCYDNGDLSACAGDSTTVAQVVTFGDGLKLMAFPIGTQTLPTTVTATGWDITGDLTADDGFEVVAGVPGSAGRPFIVGDDPAFYFCATVKVTDVSGTDDMHIGFRRAEPINATFDNYLDLASIGPISGTITIETILNNAGTTTTSTTDSWADAATKKVCIYVNGSGAVTYKIDNVAPTVTAAFTFDDGDPVIPFIHLLQDTDIAETTAIVAWEQGYQE